MSTHDRPPRTYNQNHVPRAPHRRAAHQHLLDMELSLGSATRSGAHGEPLLHDDRGAQRAVAGLRDAGVRRGATSCRASRARWNCSTARPWHSRSWPGRPPGHPVAVFQRIDQAGYKLPIDERILADTDTLMVFGLDHLLSEQEAAPEEIAAITEWLKREGTCLLLAPHHDVGFTDDYDQRQMEYQHHGDRLVPRQQRFSQYTRSLMKALDVPVHNIWGLRPAVVEGTKEIAPLTAIPRPRHPAAARQRHHLQLPPAPAALRTHGGGKRGARPGAPAGDPARPHPFTEAGNTEFNALIWMPPTGQRAGDIVLVDSTHFTTLFGGTDSLETSGATWL